MKQAGDRVTEADLRRAEEARRRVAKALARARKRLQAAGEAFIEA